MSTAARKSRKRAGEKLTRAPKIGTPVELRTENQARPISLSNRKSHRFGLTIKAARRLASRGLSVEVDR